MRLSYRPDASFLIRFMGAVPKDNRRTEDWKRKARFHANSLVQLLLQAEAEDLAQEEQKSAKRGRASVAKAV
ncbi:MAG TPA: hypothetical protein DCX12_01960 [Chloroflexi bacterium]|jgi:hypothetical protein|nr:hypothetical protein [Chloroflexota bacterium]